MTEPDVTLTDFALAVECAVFFVLIFRRENAVPQLRSWLLVYFATAGIASFCGGLVHGFFLAADSTGRGIFWSAALLAIGFNSLAAIGFGALLLFSQRTARVLARCGIALLAAYAVVVLSGIDSFFVAVAVALPASLFAVASLIISGIRDARHGALWAAAGMACTMLAALLQQFRIAANPEYFNHNATAHVVQMLALALFFAGCVKLLNSIDAESDRSIPCLHDASS